MNIDFPLKEGDREKQKLCDKHHMQLYHILDHELGRRGGTNESKNELPPKYDDLDKFKLAVTAVQGTSLSTAGPISLINQAESIEEIKETEKYPSKETVALAVMELHMCYRYWLAEKLIRSDDLILACDTAKDRHREFMAIHIAGLNGEEEELHFHNSKEP